MLIVRKNSSRLYIFGSAKEVPNIKNLILNAESNIAFINSATLNPQNENTELYSHFDSSNYNSFLYAFAYQIGQLDPTSVASPQFEMNARRFERLCQKRNIVLSEQESLIINYCKAFQNVLQRYDERVSFSISLLSDLTRLYS